MFRFLKIFAYLLFVYGAIQTYMLYSFVVSAIPVQGRIAPSEPYRGPPRSPRAIPIAVTFTLPNTSGEITTSLPSPLFRKPAIGDPVLLYVNPHQPNQVRFTSLADLWAYPGGLVLGSLILFALSSAALRVGQQQDNGNYSSVPSV